MNKLIILAVVLASLSCLVYARNIRVTVQEGYNGMHHRSPHDFTVDDSITVRELAAKAMGSYGMGSDADDDVRLENSYLKKYNMEKTLREAGIKDGSKVILKFWSRLQDFGANTLLRLSPLDD